jgi:hypothetical protein
MKQKSLLKTMLLLCALIAGSSSVWADNQTKVVNFENDLATYTEWSFTDLTCTTGETIGSGNSAVTTNPHGGSYFAKTSLSSGSWAVTKSKIATPISLVCYYTKCTTNTNASSLFKIQVSSDGSEWTDVSSGKTMNNVTGGTWEELSADLSKYSDVYVRVYYKGTTAIRALDDITLTYDPGVIVNVAGVSLNKNSTSIVEGQTETLTATISPNDATDQIVNWTSSEESVATVSDGVVTAVSPGTSTITVTTNDGGFTATCEVTVTAKPAVAVTFDLSTNIFSFPEGSSKKTTASNNYTYGGYTINLAGGGSGNGYYWNTDGYFIMGKSGCALTFPAFPFNVSKIKVYGTSGASTGVKQNIFVGETAVSTETTGAKDVVNEYEIAAGYQAAGNVYVLKVTSNHNTQISKIEIIGYVNATIAASGYSTIAKACGLDFSQATPAGLEAYVASAVTASGVTLSPITAAPKNTGVILKGAAGTEYTIPVKEGAAAVGTNYLKAAVSAYNCAANEVYILKGGKFCKVTAASTVPAGKAYLLASDVPASAPELEFNFGGTTGINSVDSGQVTVNSSEVYNLAGQRVAQPSKGLYIVNGKKVVIK